MKLSENQSQLVAQLVAGVCIVLFLALIFFVHLDKVLVFGVPVDDVMTVAGSGIAFVSGGLVLYRVAQSRTISAADFAPAVLALQGLGRRHDLLLTAMNVAALALSALAVILVLARRRRSGVTP